MKDQGQLLRVFKHGMLRAPGGVSRDETVLIIGATEFDRAVLADLGFHTVTASCFSPGSPSDLSIDAEDIAFSDGSFDLLFAHEVLHHVRSPHKALCEMLRVARRHVVFMEPNDSLVMRMLVATGLSFPFEVLSVQVHGFEAGGVRDSNIPNYIYRWTRREVEKTVSSYLPESGGLVHASGYWDFNVDDLDLSLRESTTRLRMISAILGERYFFALLRRAQSVLNRIPGIRRQGNKFFCVIEKESRLRPWLKAESHRVVFDRSFSVHRQAVGAKRRPSNEGASVGQP